MGQSPSEADGRSENQENFCLLWNPEVHCCAYRSKLRGPVGGQMKYSKPTSIHLNIESGPEAHEQMEDVVRKL
jgi:hypothetical protein